MEARLGCLVPRILRAVVKRVIITVFKVEGGIQFWSITEALRVVLLLYTTRKLLLAVDWSHLGMVLWQHLFDSETVDMDR